MSTQRNAIPVRRQLLDALKPLLEVLKDFGVLPLLLISLSGFGWIDLIERGLKRDLDLITPLEIAHNGYSRLVEALGTGVETAFSWMTELLGWRVTLLPDWQSYFMLATIIVVAVARSAWRERAPLFAVGFAIAMSALAFVLTALVPLDSLTTWSATWHFDTIAASGGPWYDPSPPTPPTPPTPLQRDGQFLGLSLLIVTETLIASAFPFRTTSAELENAPLVERAIPFLPCLAWSSAIKSDLHSGLLALVAVVACAGVSLITLAYLRSRRIEGRVGVFETRVGLTALGGVFAAALVLAADWLVKIAM